MLRTHCSLVVALNTQNIDTFLVISCVFKHQFMNCGTCAYVRNYRAHSSWLQTIATVIYRTGKYCRILKTY